ncbi:MAG: hypothetical protein V3R66_00750 [Rhodospirillales bacterium]
MLVMPSLSSIKVLAWRRLYRYRGRLAFVGGCLAAAATYRYVRSAGIAGTDGATAGGAGWTEAAGAGVAAFFVVRGLLKKTFDVTVNYVASSTRELARMIKGDSSPEK